MLGTSRRWRRADIAAKAVLVGLLVFAATHTDWGRFAVKTLTARLVGYPLVLPQPSSERSASTARSSPRLPNASRATATRSAT